MIIAKSTPPQFSSSDAQGFAQELFGIEVTSIKSLGSFIDQNFLVIDNKGREYTLKVHDGEELEAVLDLQNQAMNHLNAGIADIKFPRAFETISGGATALVEDGKGNQHFVRLLSFIPGSLLKDIDKFSDGLLNDIGKVLASMDKTLQGFSHPAANRPDLPWDLKNAGTTKQLSSYIKDHHQRRIAEYFFLQFDAEVAPLLPSLRKSIVHNDSHRYSLLVGDEPDRISGVIDFGDTVYTYTVTNLAVSLSDIMVQCSDPIASATRVIASYHATFALSEEEVSLLYYLICTRLSIYGCMSAYAAAEDPGNSHAQLKTAQVWELLDRLLAVNPTFAEDQFRSACGMPSLKAERQNQTESNISKRGQYFPQSLYTHYDEALSLSKGALQYLYDDNGKTYLDCVNNVCQWGHCNPRIVRAGQGQMANLNTNSRYVYQQMTDYAERLLATFPGSLDVCFFVNSGSEANDLAMRLARTYTGNTDMIVIDKAYHGNSTVCTDISPNRIDREGGPGLPNYVHSTLIPDTFRGIYKSDDPDACHKYADDIKRITDDLAITDRSVAAFYAESLIGTGGQIVLPDGYLTQAYQHVRDAGGVCIADEVQVGFGRTGNQTWCFEAQNVVPDIVTIGKPIGNGHPMAAVVTTRAIAEAFDSSGITYFNTFGGNPVSCAIGLAVLDTFEQEQLEENARLMGELLMSGLKELQSRHRLIADVRGQGLYIGVELLADMETLVPATKQAKQVVEQAKAMGMLLNVNGYDNNIIKIKPPLIIDQSDVARIVSILDAVFSRI